MASGRSSSTSAAPRLALWLAAAVLASTVAWAGWVRLSGQSIRAPDAPAAAQRSLLFIDQPDGAIAVTDAASGALAGTVVGEAGFVRGTLRGLARERKRQGIGPGRPFVLIGRADGRLTLHDPATGRLVDLESFGPVNAAEFARFLPTASPTVSPGARS